MTPTSFNSSSEGETNESELDSTSEDLIFNFAAYSLRENDFEAFEKSYSSGEPRILTALKEWGPVIEELSLAMPPVNPNPDILNSLLARIGSQHETTSSVKVGFESTAEAGGTAGAMRPAEGSEQKSLMIRRATQVGWRSAGSPGAKIRILNFDRRQGRTTYLLQIEAGGSYPEHLHHADEECYVISGDIQDGELSFAPGDYFLAPAGSEHGALTTIEGCLCLITTGIPVKI